MVDSVAPVVTLRSGHVPAARGTPTIGTGFEPDFDALIVELSPDHASDEREDVEEEVSIHDQTSPLPVRPDVSALSWQYFPPIQTEAPAQDGTLPPRTPSLQPSTAELDGDLCQSDRVVVENHPPSSDTVPLMDVSRGKDLHSIHSETSHEKRPDHRVSTSLASSKHESRAALDEHAPSNPPNLPDGPPARRSDLGEGDGNMPGPSTRDIPPERQPVPTSGPQLMVASPPTLTPARQLIGMLASPPARAALQSSEVLASGGTIRVLRMTFRPEFLGAVEVALRRSGDEMKISITVMKQDAAEVLEPDIGTLRDRIGDLLPKDTAHSIVIVVQPAEGTEIPHGSMARGMNDATGTWQGGPFSGNGRSPSHKEQMPSRPKGRDGNEQDALQYQPRAGGLVV